jgi:hypothetical protein
LLSLFACIVVFTSSLPLLLSLSFRAFLNSLATDIVEMKNCQLLYFSGSYEDWLIHCGEMTARKANLADARIRKESHIQKTIDNANARGDDKQAKAKQKKLERASMTRGLWVDSSFFLSFFLSSRFGWSSV